MLYLLPDSIEHTFLDCTITTAFYSKAVSWFNHENDTNITLISSVSVSIVREINIKNK